ncbi:hypothetical protein JKP88DRAFT_200140 [Tribonema minus]|uniref:Dimethylargininase n=1 Tax=Tribonema minus TaxID=303371 RepID=A0A836CCP0_9STRA|nr:hypothetical protein JKP88DRAFT_200140 [Tribonema minus]
MIKGRLLALVRQVPNSFGQAVSLSQPAGTLIDVALARRQWDAYVGTLRHLVDEVVEVPASEDHPECAAIEDLLVFARGSAVLTKPGNPSRRGEAAAVRSSLENNEGIKGIKLHMMSNMDPQATLNGHDVLFTGKHMFVGLNARTNDAGVECLKRAFGKSLPVIPIDLEGIGASAASLKSLVTSLRPGLLCVAANDVGLEVAGRMADAVGRSSYKAIAVPDEPSANVLSLNSGKWRGALLQADRCENSVGLIRGAFELNEQNSILEHEMSEFVKAGMGLTSLCVFVESVHT